jgi:hypothetical protein
MLQQTALTGLTTAQLETLHTQACLDYFADDTTDSDRDVLDIVCSNIKNSLPASFVLASLFDVEAMSNDIPEHVYEADPLLEWVTCPCCDGEKWLEVEGNGWCDALFSDPRRAYAYRALNRAYKVCGRCSGSGEVLDDPTAFDEQEAFDELGCSSNKVQTESAKTDLMNTLVTYKEIPTIWQLAA